MNMTRIEKLGVRERASSAQEGRSLKKCCSSENQEQCFSNWLARQTGCAPARRLGNMANAYSSWTDSYPAWFVCFSVYLVFSRPFALSHPPIVKSSLPVSHTRGLAWVCVVLPRFCVAPCLVCVVKRLFLVLFSSEVLGSCQGVALFSLFVLYSRWVGSLWRQVRVLQTGRPEPRIVCLREQESCRLSES